ncbi:amidohydrolase family protein [Streptomyces sp. DSM 44915]|uniref:Amidohydrolase family protein n=1 Tax=Streptomyces chisholmiae TaxID=3075540 RepID=A0ABU2JN03_9ACTN|nr:amidohydrolase family protein [Streptomyces sp. DSM 44915]MDT0266372.1 amidohydrolase family protein [Streptomyces sp. DSM 44915]
MSGPTVIDAHHHLWDPAHRPQPWLRESGLDPLHRAFTVAELAATAGPAGVAGTVLVQVLPDPAETAEFLAVADGSSLVRGVVGWVDLTAGRAAVADELARLRAGSGGARLVGVRHLVQGEADPRWLCRPEVRAGLSAVAAAGLAYDLLVRPHQLPAAVATVRALPELTWVLDHLAKPPVATGELAGWAEPLRELAAEPGVSCKLSGLVTEADWRHWTVDQLRPFAGVALDAFGPERLMFGSDWPVCLAAASYTDVLGAAEELTAELTPAERAAVFGDTARRVYRLPD